MKDRIALLSLIIFLWVILFYLEVYLPFIPSPLIILSVIIVYCMVLAFAQFICKCKRFNMNDIKADEEYFPSVNIFIPAHNEELVLEKTIENLVNIDYPNYDILIIDDRSKDKTYEIAKKLSEKYKSKVSVYSRNDDAFPGKSAVLNDAFEMTKGDVICVFDADAKVESDFLTSIIPYLADDKVAAVQARKVMSNKNLNALTRFQHYEYCMDANVQMGRDSLKGAVELRGNGELIKRSALEDVQGWNIYTLTDDLDISTKLQLANYDIRFCPNVLVYEEAVDNFNNIIKQRKRWAEGSIRRYIDYFTDIVTSKTLSLRVSLDMLVYFSEFILPIWLISDFVMQLGLIIAGSPPNFFLNFLILLAIGVFFTSMLFTSIIKLENIGIFASLKWAIGTALFVVALWTIVVLVVFIKIIFTERSLKWYKTDRAEIVS